MLPRDVVTEMHAWLDCVTVPSWAGEYSRRLMHYDGHDVTVSEVGLVAEAEFTYDEHAAFDAPPTRVVVSIRVERETFPQAVS